MGTVRIEELRKRITPMVPGCPEMLVDREVITVTREICERTKMWKEPQEVTSSRAKMNILDLGPYPDAEVISVEYVAYNKLELIQTNERELSEYFPRWRDINGPPTHFFHVRRDKTIHLYPCPNLNMPRYIKYEVIVKPSLDAETIPDFIYESATPCIIDGALSNLMFIAGKEWSNPDEAMRRRGLFDHGVYRLRDLSTRMYASQNLNLTPDCIY